METDNIRKVLSSNKVKLALTKLSDLVENEFPSFRNDIVLILRRYNEVETEIQNNLISKEKSNIVVSKIAFDILRIIGNIEARSMHYEKIASPLDNKLGLIEILIDDDIESFTIEKRETILNIIAAVLEIDRDSIIIKKVLKGSVKLYIQIDVTKIEVLNDLLNSKVKDKRLKLLEEFDVKNIKSINLSYELINENVKLINKEILNSSFDIFGVKNESPPKTATDDDEDWFDKLS